MDLERPAEREQLRLALENAPSPRLSHRAAEAPPTRATRWVTLAAHAFAVLGAFGGARFTSTLHAPAGMEPWPAVPLLALGAGVGLAGGYLFVAAALIAALVLAASASLLALFAVLLVSGARLLLRVARREGPSRAQEHYRATQRWLHRALAPLAWLRWGPEAPVPKRRESSVRLAPVPPPVPEAPLDADAEALEGEVLTESGRVALGPLEACAVLLLSSEAAVGDARVAPLWLRTTDGEAVLLELTEGLLCFDPGEEVPAAVEAQEAEDAGLPGLGGATLGLWGLAAGTVLRIEGGRRRRAERSSPLDGYRQRRSVTVVDSPSGAPAVRLEILSGVLARRAKLPSQEGQSAG